MKVPKLRRVACVGCQAKTDGQTLFGVVEAIAIEQDIAPDRMRRALTEALAIWAGIALQFAAAEAGQATLDADLDAQVTDFAIALRTGAEATGPQMLSADFKARTAQLVRDTYGAADHRGHA